MWSDSRTYLRSKPVEDNMAYNNQLMTNGTSDSSRIQKRKLDSSTDVHIEGFTSQQPDDECIPLKLHHKIEQYHRLHNWTKQAN